MSKLRVGVSACLLGQEVRYDGNHKRNRFVVEILGPHVEWVPICPEVEIGLGIPREAIHLEGSLEQPRLVGRRTQTDHTDAMTAWSQACLESLQDEELSGYIFKSKSPSCGLFRIPVLREDGATQPEGRGLFAQALTQRWPLLPVEEEGRLNNPVLRDNFIQHMYVYHRWHTFLREDPTPAGLIKFHTSHKMLLLAHHEPTYRQLGQLVAQAGTMLWDELVTQYSQQMHTAMVRPVTRNTHSNVLQHLMGYLKKEISSDEKQELLELIHGYRQGKIPLIAPLTLLRHHFRHKHVPDWIHQQVYLDPYPKELMVA